jgi:hypothetical protein
MSYILAWEERGVYSKFSGIVSGAELMQCNRDIYGDVRFDTIKYQLFDMLDTTGLAIDALDVRKVAACDNAAAITNPNVKCALVAINENAHILSEVYQSGISESPWEGLSFITIQEARAWLS